MTTEQTSRIVELNDLARTAMGVASKVIATRGFRALPQADQSAFREAIEKFKEWTEGNDPHGEHDFGAITIEGVKVFWKIDYYDKALEYGSESPWNPAVTTRVLTIMLADEY